MGGGIRMSLENFGGCGCFYSCARLLNLIKWKICNSSFRMHKSCLGTSPFIYLGILMSFTRYTELSPLFLYLVND